jgi:ATP-dependent DNA helicase RecQ
MATNLQKQGLLLLRQALDNSTANFRPGQWEAIEELLQQRSRLLVVQRTGWGKSLVYFLATRLLRDRGAGSTLLISPLLALMRNQIAAAQRIARSAFQTSRYPSFCPLGWGLCQKVISNSTIKAQKLFRLNPGIIH